MAKKEVPPKKMPKEGQVVIRVSAEELQLIERLRQRLADPYRGAPNVTQTITAALRIAEEALKAKAAK